MPIQLKTKNFMPEFSPESIVKGALDQLKSRGTAKNGEFSTANQSNLNTTKLNIICLSNQQWDYPLPTNKRHVMERLQKFGHSVLFVEPPINAGRMFLRQLLRGQWGLARIFSRIYGDNGVTIFSPLNFVPNSRITSEIHIEKINKLAKKKFDPANKTILWVYHVEMPELENFVSAIPHDLLVYDCVDNYTAFPDRSLIYSATAGKQQVAVQERLLTEKADLVFATAPGLVDKLKKYREVVHFTPNVGDYEKFKRVPTMKESIPQDLSDIRRPRIGFTGAVDDYKFDKDLVWKLAKDHPDYSFVIIGPFALKDREGTAEEIGLSELPNVYFLGARPFSVIDKYFAGFDAYMIPFQLNDYTVGGCFPIKFHDALAAGLPTIVTDLPTYTPFKSVCYISKNYEEFSQNIVLALKEDSDIKIKERQKVAAENSWDGKIAKLLSLIHSALKEV